MHDRVVAYIDAGHTICDVNHIVDQRVTKDTAVVADRHRQLLDCCCHGVEHRLDDVCTDVRLDVVELALKRCNVVVTQTKAWIELTAVRYGHDTDVDTEPITYGIWVVVGVGTVRLALRQTLVTDAYHIVLYNLLPVCLQVVGLALCDSNEPTQLCHDVREVQHVDHVCASIPRYGVVLEECIYIVERADRLGD